jgi:hypothetical protein
MKRLVPYLLLLVGISLAAAFGSRNGDTHSQYRAAVWYSSALQAAPADLEERGINYDNSDLDAARGGAKKAQEAIGLPAPGKRLSEWWSTGGLGWLLGVVLIAAGAGLARRQLAQDSTGTSEEGSGQGADFLENIRSTRSRLDTLASSIRELGMDVDAPEAREELDKISAELLMPVVDARGRYVARHGIGVFAEYFGLFAAGERNLARCWSALTDGHSEVARAALEVAQASFAEAEAAWLKAEGSLAA